MSQIDATPTPEPVPVSATTTQPINLVQLVAAIGSSASVKVAGNPDDGSVKTVTVSDLDQATLNSRLATYVYDANYGVPAERITLDGLAAKAQQVLAGTATFTTAEINSALAALITKG